MEPTPKTLELAAADLRARWAELKAAEPMIRARDAAVQLGVSEAELVACRCGEAVRRLDNAWGPMIKGFPGLGQVMVLTRNAQAVHEKVGTFGKISIFKSMGLVLDDDIDLRLFLDHWHSGYAVSEETRSGLRHSLQFFDLDGTAVHKLYLRPESDQGAYDALVRRHLHADQQPGQAVSVLPAPLPDRPDRDIDRATLRRRWQALQDVHDFHAMLKELGVGRLQAFRLIGDDFAQAVGTGAFPVALEAAAQNQTPIMVFTGSPGVIQIHTGPVRRLKVMGPWFNVLDEGFNLHLRTDGIAQAWVVRKPTRDGLVTSLEIFDANDRQIAWMFGARKAGETERDDWRGLVAALESQGETV